MNKKIRINLISYFCGVIFILFLVIFVGCSIRQSRGLNDPDYEARISKLEKEVEELKGKLKDYVILLADLNDKMTNVNASLKDIQRILNQSTTDKSTTNRAPIPSNPPKPNDSSDVITNIHPASQDFIAKYKEALELYENRYYDKAIDKFEDLLEEENDCDLSDNCLYWIGECYFGKGEYQLALNIFEKLLSIYPTSNKISDATYMKARANSLIGNKDSAIRDYNSVIDNYPDSEFATLAHYRLREIGQ